MFVEKLEDLPESLRDQFVEVEVDGKKGYQDKDSVELKQHLFNVKDENKTLKATREEFEKQQREAAEAKLQEQLEDARKANNLDEVLRIEREKAEDAARRAREEGKSEAVKEFNAARATDKRELIIAQLAAKGVNAGAREAMRDSLEKHVSVCPDTFQIIFKDSKGGALSVDAEGFAAEMLKMEKFSMLMEIQPPNSGAPGANGNSGGGASVKSLSEMTATEEALFAKQHPDRYQQLLNSLMR
jgi:hypothetical protein